MNFTQEAFAFVLADEERLSRAVDRFMCKVDVCLDLSSCWLWIAGGDGNGYGQFGLAWFRKKSITIRAHSFSYRIFVGEIPEGLVLDHLCRVPRCVRPDHLEPVTDRVNLLRGEGPTAKHAVKTACHRGHDFNEKNTYITPAGTRQCRACAARWQAAFRARRKIGAA